MAFILHPHAHEIVEATGAGAFTGEELSSSTEPSPLPFTTGRSSAIVNTFTVLGADRDRLQPMV